MAHVNYQALQREYAKLAPRYDIRWKAYIEASSRHTLRPIDIESGQRLLDVGCGTGALLGEVVRTTPHARLAGVDLSAEMLGVARGRLGASVDLKRAGAESLPYGDEAFHAVVSSSVLHFIRDPVTALKEMHRVLKPAGTLVITDWCDDDLACRLCDLFLRAFDRAHGQTYGMEELRALLEHGGFTNIGVTRYKISLLWGMMTATAAKA